jgi:hypothetical protein
VARIATAEDVPQLSAGRDPGFNVPDPVDSGLSALAGGLSDLSAGLQERADKQERQALADADAAFSLQIIEAHEAFRDDRNHNDLPDRFQSDLETRRRKIAGGLSGDALAEFNRRSSVDVAAARSKMAGRAEKLAIDQTRAWAEGSLADIRAKYLDSDDTTEREFLVNGAMAVVDSAVERGAVSAEAGVGLKTNFAASAAEGGILLLPDAEQIAELSEPSGLSRFIDPVRRAALKRQAEARLKRANADNLVMERFEVNEAIKADIASVASTGVGVPGLTEARIAKAAGGGAKGKVAVLKYREARSAAVDGFVVGQELTDATPAEAIATLQNLQPKPGSANFDTEKRTFDAAVNAWQKIAKERADDPAGYVERTFKPVQTVQNAGQAARISLRQQEALGIPKGLRRVLPKARRQALVMQIEDSPAGDVGGQITALRDLYGENFGRMMTELAAEGLDPKMQILVSLNGNPAASRTMAVAIGTGTKALTEAQPDGFSYKEFRAAVTGAGGDFWSAVEFGAIHGTRVPLINANIDAITDLAMQYRIQGNSESEAIRRATDSVVTTQYDVRDTYYIPRRIGVDLINTERVVTFLKSKQREADVRAFDPFPFGIDDRVPGAVDIDDLQEQTIRAAADPSRAKWATKADGSGAFLMVQDVGSGAWHPLLNQEGDLYEVDFVQASNVAPISRVEAGKDTARKAARRPAPQPGVTRLPPRRKRTK